MVKKIGFILERDALFLCSWGLNGGLASGHCWETLWKWICNHSKRIMPKKNKLVSLSAYSILTQMDWIHHIFLVAFFSSSSLPVFRLPLYDTNVKHCRHLAKFLICSYIECEMFSLTLRFTRHRTPSFTINPWFEFVLLSLIS